MFILVYGKDFYRVNKKIKEIVNSYDKSKLIALDEQQDYLNIIKGEFTQESIFKEDKIILLDNLLKSIQQEKNLKLNKKPQKVIVIAKEEKVLKKDLSFFEKNGKVFNFEPLKKPELISWIKEEVKSRKGEIEKDAIDLLADFTGNDLWLVSNEIDKLISYKKGVIEKKDVALLTRPKIEGDIFKAIDFLASKKRKEALDLFYRHIEKGDHILYLITMIAYQFRNLIIVKMSKGKESKELGMHPFVFYKSFQQAKRFTESDLKLIYDKIIETEELIKTGKADPETAFDMLITSIS